MSGGHFNYQQHKMFDIAESIQAVIDKNGQPMTENELSYNFISKEMLKTNPEYGYHSSYSPEVIEKLKEGVEIIRRAHIYAHRIDWLISDDDSEESFLMRLKKDLDGL